MQCAKKSLIVSLFILNFYEFRLLNSQDLQSNLGEAPTSFQSEVEGSPTDSLERTLTSTPSVQVNNNGSDGKVQLMSSRGSDTSSVAVSLEGIPLNTPSEGYFNLGDLDAFGLQKPVFIRGAYGPLSSNPQGHLRLRLPSDESSESFLSIGRYNRIATGVLVPGASASFRFGENNFLYQNPNDSSQFLKRKHNQNFNANIRAWHRERNQQLWLMFLFSDQNNPASSDGVFSESEITSYRPILAYQRNLENWTFDLWGSFRNLEYSSGSFEDTTKDFATGQRAEWSYGLSKNLNTKFRLEQNQSKILEKSPFRHQTNFAPSVVYELKQGQILHPQLRIEYLSDLSPGFSFHPALGGSHQITEELQILWNASWISRAPTLFERFSSTDSIASNPELKRQKTLGVDMGYELRIHQLFIQQAFFWNQIDDLIQFDFEELRTRNFGRAKNYGVENILNWQASSFFSAHSSYTFLISKLDQNDRIYQARHRASLRPEIRPHHQVRFSVPVFFRSRLPVQGRSSLPEQWDLGLDAEYFFDRWIVNLQIFNLIGWNREEIAGFPMEQESFWKVNLRYRFGNQKTNS